MISHSQIPGAGSHRRPQYRRSRNGCLTCKRRKVRCNEERPRCYHCDRLSLECVWKGSGLQHLPPAGARAEEPHEADQASLSADIFDFAQSIVDGTADLSTFQDMYFPPLNDLPVPVDVFQDRGLSPNSESMGSTPAPSGSPVSNVHVDDSLKPNLPPILDPIESGPRSTSAKELFHSLATSSPMVRYAIAAFTMIQSSSTEGMVDYKLYYDKAARELSESIQNPNGQRMSSGQKLQPILATIFFLTYIDVCLPSRETRSRCLLTFIKLLTGHLNLAYLNLEKAHNVLRAAGIGGLGSIGSINARFPIITVIHAET
jgi:hypothetical protein